MDDYSALHLQKNLDEVLALAEVSLTVLLNRGQPRLVLMSVGEFRRLKELAGEPVPAAAMARRPLTVREKAEDPLGYDTSDFHCCANEMAEAALSRRNAKAVEAELARVRARLANAQPPERQTGGRGA